ncbi:thiamine pyrophosphate-requiring protein [Pseudoduganella umbonata]|uniref:Pyruvate dehydrogenase (Quinone) n=1 Tax=Pseudoduganella umbonata TaxID=864828 RepID=A0A4P8HPC0_9BURK|nr:thiamine pyrophosphate-requiring protein [Pseudoduganella umbonata]MBB3220993.1 pyruvate dehydrogenase (quinone) [Pseudoduganella umbonata]QCP11567.1 thiamine pyrophosphate-requiring protein [Pseudoduganella umbonata]
MADTVGDFLLQRLGEWGVRRVYGYPGDGINGIMGAFGRQELIEFIQVRHEEMAAFMATAHAKFTGEVGVCLATSGPGAVHLLNGLYDAKLDHQGVVAIVGQQKRMSMGSDYQQEVDLQALFKDVAHEYVHMATDPAQVRHLIDRAFRIAKEERAVTCLIFPNDVQELDAVPKPPREHGTVVSGIGALTRSHVPPQDALQQAARILNEGKKVAILAGAGALHATDELIEVADILGAGIAKALLGKAAVPDDLPFVTGTIGLLGTKPSHDMMNDCDTLLMVGSNFPYSEHLPKEGQARGVQIDIDARRASVRYPMEFNLIGDSRETLRALIPLLQRKTERQWQDDIRSNVERWWRVLEGRAMNEANPINPQRVFWELSPRLPDDCIIVGDSGSATNWYARDVKIRRGMMTSVSGGLSTMGCAVPYAIAAKFAHPDRHVIALVGDGAMQMNGINGLITIAKYWRRWGNGKLVVMVLNNQDLNLVTWEERVMGANPKFEASQVMPDFPYAQYAELVGLKGIRIDSADAVAAGWEAALASDRPCVLEMVTDPHVPPLPPDVPVKQAAAYFKALLKGDPDALATVRASIKETWEGWFPPKKD